MNHLQKQVSLPDGISNQNLDVRPALNNPGIAKSLLLMAKLDETVFS